METRFSVTFIVWLLAFIIRTYASNQYLECPSEKYLKFCRCVRVSDEGPTTVTCLSVPGRVDLRREIKHLKDGLINHFYIANSELGYLPGNVFVGTRIRRLEISFTPLTDVAKDEEDVLMGQRHILKELVLRYCGLTNRIDWSRLRELELLQALDLSFNPLVEILDDTFALLPVNLKELYLKGCRIKFLSVGAFAALSKLVVLDLSENFIVEILRSMFPRPANLLQYLYLSSNSLRELPRGVFSDMIKLTTVYVDGNSLRHLPQDVWMDIWENHVWENHPRTVDFLGNDVVCNQGLCWLTFHHAPFLRGSCSDPDFLRGRHLSSLMPWDIHCNGTTYPGNLSLPLKSVH